MSQRSSSSRSFGESVQWLWHESLARNVVVEKDGKRPFVLPLLVVIVIGVFAPWLLAIGGVVAVLTGHTLSVERKSDELPTLEPAAPGEPSATTAVDVPEGSMPTGGTTPGPDVSTGVPNPPGPGEPPREGA